MDEDWDEDYERVSDFNMSESESEAEDLAHETPSSTPPISTPSSSRRKTIPCPYEQCFKMFNRPGRLREHLRSHTNTRIFKCPFPTCIKDYIRESHLKHHVKSAHSTVRDYKCTWEGCDKKFATGTRLRTHLQAHEGREKFRCRGYNGCNETFRKHDTLQRHILTTHEKMKPFPCLWKDSSTNKQCEKAFDTAEYLRRHERAKHNPNRFTCSECMLKNASEEGTGTAGIDYQPLPWAFATYSEHQEHLAEYHPLTCSYCQSLFRTNKELSRHLELEHDMIRETTVKKSKLYHCTYPTCDKNYSKQGNLKVHIQTSHENRRDFVCGVTEIALTDEVSEGTVVEGCGQEFTTKASLKEHVRTAHLGLKRKQSIRKLRKEKRKASARDSDNEDDNPDQFKTRRGKKLSAIEKLTGLPTPTAPTITHQEPEGDEENSDAESDEYSYLSGSMTMLGNQIYHHTGTWRYAEDVAVDVQHHGTESDYMIDERFHSPGVTENYSDDQYPVIDPELFQT